MGRRLVVIGVGALAGAVPLASTAWADGPVGDWGRQHAVPRHHAESGTSRHKPAKSRTGGKSAKSGSARVAKAAKVGIAVQSPATPVLPGRNYSWPYEIVNRGPVQAGQVTFTAPLPSTLHFVSAQQNCSWQTNAVVCRLGTFKPGQSRAGVITAQVDSSLKPGQTVSSPAMVSWGNGTSTSQFPPVRIADSADVAVTKSAPAQTRAGQSIPYKITVTNNGPSAAQNIVLHDTVQLPSAPGRLTLPADVDGTHCTADSQGATAPTTGGSAPSSAGQAGEQHKGQSPNEGTGGASGQGMGPAYGQGMGSAYGQGADAASDQDAADVTGMICSLGALGPGQVKSLTLHVKPAGRLRPGALINAPAEVSSSTFDTDLTNNHATVRTKVLGAAAARVHPDDVSHGMVELPNTGAPLKDMLDDAAGLIGFGLILHRLGRPRRRLQ